MVVSAEAVGKKDLIVSAMESESSDGGRKLELLLLVLLVLVLLFGFSPIC